jgi:hypothetical protein
VQWEQHIIGESEGVHFQIKKQFGGAVNSFTGAWPAARLAVGRRYDRRPERLPGHVLQDRPDRSAADAMPEQSDTFKVKITDAEQTYAKALFGTAQTSRDGK